MNTPRYKVINAPSGERVVCYGENLQNEIPADIAGLCRGRDKWLSEIKCACRDCKKEFPLSELHGGGQWCEECQTAGMEE